MKKVQITIHQHRFSAWIIAEASKLGFALACAILYLFYYPDSHALLGIAAAVFAAVTYEQYNRGMVFNNGKDLVFSIIDKLPRNERIKLLGHLANKVRAKQAGILLGYIDEDEQTEDLLIFCPRDEIDDVLGQIKNLDEMKKEQVNDN